MWGVSGKIILGVRLEVNADQRLQTLEQLGSMEVTGDIVYLEGSSTGIALWFSVSRHVLGDFVAQCSKEIIPFELLHPLGQYVAGHPDDISPRMALASDGMDTNSVSNLKHFMMKRLWHPCYHARSHPRL
jgi:hypothetical protein